VAVSLKSATML